MSWQDSVGSGPASAWGLSSGTLVAERGWKHWDVRALRQLDEYGIAGARPAIIFRKLLAQTTGLDAHNRISFWVIIDRTVEGLDRDHIFFKLVLFPSNRAFHHEVQKLAGPACVSKESGRKDALQLLAHGVRGHFGHTFQPGAGACSSLSLISSPTAGSISRGGRIVKTPKPGEPRKCKISRE